MKADDRTQDSTSQVSAVDRTSPPHYEIRVKGHLDARWAARFDGLRLTNEHDGTTLLRGPIVDQAAVHGVLQTLRDIGLPLVSVTQVQPTHHRAPAAPNPTKEST